MEIGNRSRLKGFREERRLTRRSVWPLGLAKLSCVTLHQQTHKGNLKHREKVKCKQLKMKAQTQVDKTWDGEESPEGVQIIMKQPRVQDNLTEGRGQAGWAKGTAKPSYN